MSLAGAVPIGVPYRPSVEGLGLALGSAAFSLPFGVDLRSTGLIQLAVADLQALGVTPIPLLAGIPGAIITPWKETLQAQYNVFGTGVAPQIRPRYVGGATALLSTVAGAAAVPNVYHMVAGSLSGTILGASTTPGNNPPVGAGIELTGANMTGGTDATFYYRMWYFVIRVP